MTQYSQSELIRPEDVEFFERELASFVPERVFDAHCHVWHHDYAPEGWGKIAKVVDYPMYRRLMADIHPGRHVAGLFISMFTLPDLTLRPGADAWAAQQPAAAPDCRSLAFISPQDDPEQVRDQVRRVGACGLKCYHLLCDVDPTWEADIPDYLPESIVKVANDEGWVITLHMVKMRAVADPGNIHWIRHYCERYPNMKLILAHSARGFQPAHNLEGLPQLAGLDNLWFDTSANCEPMAHQAIIRILGHDRLMYGTDCPASHGRGRSVGVADTFLWLYEDAQVWQQPQILIEPVLTGLEHLRSLKWACWAERLSDSQVEDIFWNNAARLFGIPQASEIG